jgi:hypothetical protein
MSGNRSHRDIPRIARSETIEDLQRIDGSELTRYDVLLGAIPLILLAAWIARAFSGVPAWAALGVGGLVTLPVLVDGLALNPPS